MTGDGRVRRAAATAVLAALLMMAAAGSLWAAGAERAPLAQAADGVIDLTAWSAEADGPVRLTGSWLFQAGVLLTPDQVAANPNGWQKLAVPDRYGAPGQSAFGTYRLRVVLGQARVGLAMTLPDVGSAAALWIDGQPAVSIGRPGTHAGDEISGRRQGHVALPEDRDTVELVLQVSNHLQYYSRFYQAPVIDRAERIARDQEDRRIGDAALAGAALLIGLYHLVLFAAMRRDSSALLFAVVCLGGAVRVAVTGSQLVGDYLPGLPFPLVLRVEYLTFYLVTPAFAAFYAAVFPTAFWRWPVRLVVGAGVAFTLIGAFAPSLIVTAVLRGAQILALLVLVLVVAGQVRALAQALAGSRLAFGATLVLAGLVVYDILRNLGYVQGLPLIGFGLPAFFAAQAALMAVRQSAAFNEVHRLSGELADLNRGLEQQVADRTADLVEESRRLEASQRQLREILEASPLGVMIATDDESIVFRNRRVAELAGVEPDQADQVRVQDFSGDSEGRQRLLAAVRAQGLVRDTEIAFTRRDGSPAWVLVTVQLVNHEGRPAFLAWLYDITARKRAEEGLIQAEKMASLGQLVAGVAHEVNTPLGVALTAASHLDEQGGHLRRALEENRMKKSDLQAYLDLASDSGRVILANLHRAADLVQSFKQVAVDQASDERRVFDLKTYLDEVMASLRPQLRGGAVQLAGDCPVAIEMDSFPGALAQVLTNLTLNAAQHAYDPGQGGQVRLDARPLEGQDGVELVFADDGKGIAADVLPKIFDPFFTTRRSAGSSGLGLHIVFNIVNRTLKGHISVASEPGRGTRFVLRLPRRVAG